MFKQGQNVHIALERTVDVQTKVVGLDRSELGQLDVDVLQVQTGHLLVEDLGQHVDTNGLLAGSTELDVLLTEGSVLGLEQSNLGQDLVGERARHDERRVTGGTAKVDQTTLRQEDDVAAVGHQVTVNLGLDVLDALGVGLEPGNVDFNVEVTDVADNGVVAHHLKVRTAQDVTAAGGGDKDLTQRSSVLHGGDLVAVDGGLESLDGIDLSNEDTGTHAAESIGTTLANVTVTSNDTHLASNHDIGGTLDPVNERLPAPVQVVELGLGNGVVDVDGGHGQLVLLEHTVQVVDTGGGLLGETVATLELLGELGVDQGSQVTTVVQDEVELLAILESLELLLQAPVVLLLRLALPGKDGDTGSSNRRRSVVLSGEDVAASPGDLSTQRSESLNEDSSLDGCNPSASFFLLPKERIGRTHVQATGNTGTLEGLFCTVLATDSHETRHFNLGQLNLPTTESGQGLVMLGTMASGSLPRTGLRVRRRMSMRGTYDIGDLELLSGSSHDENYYC